MNKLILSLKSWSLITGMLLILVGCSTNTNRLAYTVYANEQQPISGERDMEMAQAASGNLSLGFQTNVPGKKIALLLPSKGPHAEAAKTIKEGFFAAYYNSQQQQTGSSVKVYDTLDGTAVENAFNQALADQVDMIVGPLTKQEVQTIAKLPSKVPVLSLNSLNAINTGKGSKSFYQFGLMPEDEIVAVVEHARRQGHHRAFVIAPKSEWGQRMTHTFTKAWNANGGQIAGSLALQNLDHEQQSAQIQAVMQTGKNVKRQDIDMVFLAASPELARQIKPLVTHYASVKLPVYSTATVYSGAPTPKKDHDLDGIRFCDMPWVLNNTASAANTANAADSQATVKLSSHNASPRYFAFGMDAYYLALQLEDTRSLSTGIRGATGELHLQGQRIQRRLSSAKFVNGVPVAD